MDSSLHGAPLSAIQMAPKVAAPPYNTVSGIRAPLTVDESDFEYSVSSKSRRNSATSSYYSGSELEYEGFVSGEDVFEASSERHVDEEIFEETKFVKEYEVSKGSIVKTTKEIVQERCNKENENGFSWPFVKRPDEGFGKKSGDFSGNAFLRPFVRIPDERTYKGINNVNDSDDSREFLSDSGDEYVENEDYVVNMAKSRPIVAVRDGGVSDSELMPVVDTKFPLVKKLSVPIAQVSRDSDEESQESEAVEEEGSSGIVRVPSIEVIQRVNSGPKVRLSEADEGDDDESQDENAVDVDFVEDLVLSDGVLSCKDETETGGVEGTCHPVVSADMIQDKGPGTDQEVRDDSLVEYNSVQSGDLMYLDGKIQDVDVINDNGEPADLGEGTVYPVNISSADSFAEMGCPCGIVEPVDDGDAKSSNVSLEDNLVFNDHIESEKLECEGEQAIDQNVESPSSVTAYETRSTYQCVDVKETAVEGCPQFPEMPESLTESTQVDTPDSILKDASLMGVSNASKSVLEDTKFNQEMEKESENSEHLSVEATEMEREEHSASVILLDHLQEIDGKIITDLDEGLNEDNGISDDKQIIDSAALAPILNTVTDAGAVKLTSVVDTENYSLERDSADPSSTRPIVKARNPDLFMAPSTNGELEEVLSESEKKKLEKIQQIQVKYLRLLHRLGCSLEDSVASKVLYELRIAQERSLPQMFDFHLARKRAVELETQTKGNLEFSLSILVLGKTGVGKSATINSIFGEKKAVIDAFEPATTRVKEIIDMIDGFRVKVFDTPGLRTSPTDEPINRKVLLSIKKLMQKSPPDVVLYVDRLDTQTGKLNDLPLLRLVTSHLGCSIWRRSIVVLTHAASIPPDGSDGCPLSYEVFVAQKSRIVQQLISLSSGELLRNPGSMIPISLVENHPFAETSEHGESNGENWRLQLLFLCYSIKTLSEVSSLVTIQKPLNHRSPFDLKIRSPALSYFLSSLLQSKSINSDVELGYFSDPDEEDGIEYDNLHPFRSLMKSQIAKLSNDQRKAYFDEYDYCVKLLQKKQSREEIRTFEDLRDAKNGAPNETYMEGVPDQEAISIPLPDMALPPSFDGENPSYRYRFLETSSHLLTKPVFDSHGWDHDCGHDGVLMEDKFIVSSRFPAVISVQLTKDKKEFHIQLHASISSKDGENGSTTAGLDIQRLGDKLAYTLMGEMKIKNFTRNKTAAGVSSAFLDKITVYGLRIEDHLAVGKQLILMGNAGVLQSQDDAAYGVNLDLCRRDKDYPVDQHETSVGLSIMRYRGDLLCGCNLQSQFSVGRSSKLHVRAGLNSKLSGQICIKTSCSDQLHIAALAFLPIAKAIFRKIFQHSTKDYSR